MSKTARLTPRQSSLLVSIAGAWMPIMYGREDQRLTDGLLRLKLATAADYPPPKGKAWHLTPTLLGRALGCLLHRRMGGKLKLAGVQNLAKHRVKLLASFDVEHAVDGLRVQRAARVKAQFEQAMRDERDARRTGGHLKRAGVALLANRRAELLARFDVEGAVAGVSSERAPVAKSRRK